MQVKLRNLSFAFLISVGTSTAETVTFEYNQDGKLLGTAQNGTVFLTAFDNSGNPTNTGSPSLLDEWRKTQFGTYDATGVAANTAQTNGVPNITRFALGLDLQQPLSARFQVTFNAGTSGNPGGPEESEIIFWKRKNIPGLTVRIWESSDLSQWTEGPEPVVIEDGPEFQKLRIRVPVRARNFFQLETSIQ